MYDRYGSPVVGGSFISDKQMFKSKAFERADVFCRVIEPLANKSTQCLSKMRRHFQSYLMATGKPALPLRRISYYNGQIALCTQKEGINIYLINKFTFKKF